MWLEHDLRDSLVAVDVPASDDAGPHLLAHPEAAGGEGAVLRVLQNLRHMGRPSHVPRQGQAHLWIPKEVVHDDNAARLALKPNGC